MLGFEGTTLPNALRALLADDLAGVVIYPRNFKSVEGLRALIAEIRAAAKHPILLGIDQEGGRRFALPEPFTAWPCAADLGLLDDAHAVEEVARAMARELLAVGCNLNFAPMLDLHVNAASPVTTERSFGADAQKVARLGAAFIRGMAAEGVLACAKHYPGHGDARVDPHEDLPVFHGDMARLDQMELVPFVEAIAAGVPTIMTAHILLPQIDPARPASLSRKLLHETLRQRLGFRGLILVDDIGMGAIRKRHGLGEAAMLALEAGADVVMLSHDWAAVRPTVEAVQRAYESYRFDDVEWNAGSLRIEKLRSTRSAGLAAVFATPGSIADLELVGCAEHRALSEKIRGRIAAAGSRQGR